MGWKNIAIIENEFGEVSIDGTVLKRTNTLVREINAGCICCQVIGDFKESILDVVENCNVDRLVVEPTGVAFVGDEQSMDLVAQRALAYAKSHESITKKKSTGSWRYCWV